jgi:glycyl-tRNA synthetase beta chain
LGFAKSCGVKPAALERTADAKGEYFVYRSKRRGEALKQQLAGMLETAIKKLPVAKIMRWGAGDSQFVRPVHGLVMLHGKQLVAGSVLGQKSRRKTLGHRFMGRGLITLQRARDYEQVLHRQGKVIADFDARAGLIEKELNRYCRKGGRGLKWRLGKSDELIDEVTSLVEYPVVYAGEFDRAFLEIPKECLIISMQTHQRYFPLARENGVLLNRFLFVSNVKGRTPKHIIRGNERVLQARLADAKFFFEQDKKIRLTARLPKLENVVFHGKLGSQRERVERIRKTSLAIARRLKRDTAAVEMAATLCKADLLTGMVGEFPELQGTMGYYYARHEGLAEEIAVGIRSHYAPRYADDVTPADSVGSCVALADKLDSLVGMIGVGLVPTGEKDPYGLRRQALGVIRILAEEKLPLDLLELAQTAVKEFPPGLLTTAVAPELLGFMLDRFRPYLRDKGFAPDEIDAVLSLRPTRIDQVIPRLKALQAFRRLPHAEALAAANKRIRNILRQANYLGNGGADETLYKHDAEKYLANAINEQRQVLQPVLEEGDYSLALKSLAGLRGVVDEFFDQVMVMVDDTALRDNRLALLNDLSSLFNEIADISRLQS